jgi:ubiquinone/menaquinone biosynthesis C-methylase UbiE
MDQRAVWDAAFARGDKQATWYESRPSTSLTAIEAIASSRQVPIADVGGGSSRLAGALPAAGYTDLTVLDISENALSLARRRLAQDGYRSEVGDCGSAHLEADASLRRLARPSRPALLC